MERIQFSKGLPLHSNTEYIYNGDRIDYYLDDTAAADNPEYCTQGIARVAFLLKGLRNITLDFGGATLVFHGRIVPFILDGCENVTLKNLKIDYDRPFYTQGKVLACAGGVLDVKIDEGFSYSVKDGYLYVNSDSWEKKLDTGDCLLWMIDRTQEKGYDIILGLFGEVIHTEEHPPLPVNRLSVEDLPGRVLRIRGNIPDSWNYNDGKNSLVFTHEPRDKNTILICGCRNVSVDGLTLIHGAAMGIVCMRSEDIFVSRYNMFMDFEGNGRLVTCNADAIHMYNCSGRFVLKDSYMDGLLDDTVNVHNNYLCVARAEGRDLVCVSKAHGLSFDLRQFCEGQTIAVYKGNTQEKRGSFRIEKIIDDKAAGTHLLVLDRPAGGVMPGDIVENLSAQPEILIENCKFGLFRGTMRLQSRAKTVLRNCEFGNKETSLLFTGDTVYWYESSPVQDVLIENCVFRNAGYGPRINWHSDVSFTEKENYYHRNIRIENCFFDEGTAARFSHVDGFTFVNNRSSGVMKIICSDSTNVTVQEDAVLEA